MTEKELQDVFVKVNADLLPTLIKEISDVAKNNVNPDGTYNTAWIGSIIGKMFQLNQRYLQAVLSEVLIKH